MKFTANGKTYELDETTVTFAEGELIERLTDMSYVGAGMAMRQGFLKAIRALMLIAINRVEPDTTFDDLEKWEIEKISFAWDDVVQKKAPRASHSTGRSKNTSLI